MEKSIISCLIYIIIIVIFIRAVKAEKLDMYCPANVKEFCGECGDGKGKFYIKNKGDENDSVSELLTKISNGASYDFKTVKWRRSIILAIVASILISLVVLQTIPSGHTFFMMVVLIFLVFYGSFSYYKFHYDKFPVHNIKQNVEMIRKKLELDKEIMKDLVV